VSGQAGAYVTLLLLVAAGYLLLVRPARRRAQAVQRLQSALGPGDEVMLTSGLLGTILELQDEVAQVEISPGVVVRVDRRAIGQIRTDRTISSQGSHDVSSAASETAEPAGDETPGVN
jgi:preprotein translocase subunit YajC